MAKLQDSNRRREERRVDDLKGLAWDQMQNANLACETRAEDRRFIRRAQQEQKERDMEEAIMKVISLNGVEDECYSVCVYTFINTYPIEVLVPG